MVLIPIFIALFGLPQHNLSQEKKSLKGVFEAINRFRCKKKHPIFDKYLNLLRQSIFGSFLGISSLSFGPVISLDIVPNIHFVSLIASKSEKKSEK